jgi:hypothetical protein
MLCFWRDPEKGLAEFTRASGIDLPQQITLSFEYCVEAQKGRGRPSQTDLMLISDQYAVAIEAKYTEPPYEKVKDWLGESDNKRLVLEGWLDLINAKAIEGRAGIDEILDLPYQMVHRLASACFLDRPQNVLVYQGFDMDHEKTTYYRENLERLIKLFQMPGNFSAFLINQPLRKSPRYMQLQDKWNNSNPKPRMSDDVLSTMNDKDCILFGAPKVWKID